jgi:EAL domain-containing protein (putative c-di-GMP-specific phosphodiesterase class I)
MLYAVERNEFVLHYQPQISTANGRIVGVEALVRWQHPTLGLISPADFIPIAESSRLIIPIGMWVMTTACEQIVKWHQQGFYISMSINLSPVQVEDSDLGKTISNIISTTGADPKFLIFELTEAVLAQRPEDIHAIFQPLRDIGAKLSIDDFGTGYSSLSYLKKLPVDAIKIDQSFIKDMMAGDNNGVIVTAIVSLAHSLQLNVVAEGIETDEQYKALQAVGCDEIQGFLFSRPETANDITNILSIEPTSIVLTSTPE